MSVLSVRPDHMGKFSVACDGWAEGTASLRPLTYCYGSHGPHRKCIQEKPMYSCFKSSTGASVQQWKWLCSVVQWRAEENWAEPAEGLTGAGPHTREAGVSTRGQNFPETMHHARISNWKRCGPMRAKHIASKAPHLSVSEQKDPALVFCTSQNPRET